MSEGVEALSRISGAASERLGYLKNTEVFELAEHLRRKLLNFIKYVKGKAQ